MRGIKGTSGIAREESQRFGVSATMLRNAIPTSSTTRVKNLLSVSQLREELGAGGVAIA
jgi:hypothetical protein